MHDEIPQITAIGLDRMERTSLFNQEIIQIFFNQLIHGQSRETGPQFVFNANIAATQSIFLTIASNHPDRSARGLHRDNHPAQVSRLFNPPAKRIK
jgi:hypothetical protein